MECYSERTKNGLLYTAFSRATHPDGFLITPFEGDLLDRIAKSVGMKRMLKELTRLASLAHDARLWIQREHIADMSDFHFNPKLYNTSRKSFTPVRLHHLPRDVVSSAMDINTRPRGD